MTTKNWLIVLLLYFLTLSTCSINNNLDRISNALDRIDVRMNK